MPKELSCGFILFDLYSGNILGCHPANGRKGPEMAFDIPKGHLEAGETPLQAATRELREETGIVLPEGTYIHEIGHVPYQTKKSLHLFSAAIPGLTEMVTGGKLKCSTDFSDTFGNVKPEVDSYTITGFYEWFFKNMQKHIRNEMDRALPPEPMVVVTGYTESGNRFRTATVMPYLTIRKLLDDIEYASDRNLHPHGFSFDFMGASFDSEDVIFAIRNPWKVDVEGICTSEHQFPFEEWREILLDETGESECCIQE